MTTSNEARIEISTICNYRCVFCPHSTLKRKKEIMSLSLFKEVVNKLPENITTITLSGMGESFMDKGIFDKIKILKDRGYIVNILTNGSAISIFSVNKLVKLKVDNLRISIHASDFNKYREITGATEKQYNNIETLIQLLYCFNTNMKVIVTTDMIEEDTEEVKKIRDKFESYVDLLEIWKVHNWSNKFDYRKGERTKQTCGRPFNGPLQIQVDGTVNMCCFDYDGELVIGDLKSQSLNEIFDSPMYKRIVEFHNGNSDEDNLLCKNCDQLYKPDESIIIYNSKFNPKERLRKTSTTYEDMI